eukprot:3893555-Pleurochrysis_carterae.AAC.1
MSAAGTAHLNSDLEDTLADFFDFERMTTEMSAIIRAVYKELQITRATTPRARGAASSYPG